MAYRFTKLLSLICLTLGSSTLIDTAFAKSNDINATTPATLTETPLINLTSYFKPRPQSNIKLDYDAWDSLLENMVFYTNISTRIRAPRPRPNIGSNLIHGHTSPYRLEGNKIPFSTFSDLNVETLTEYRQDLERISLNVDIPSLSKNEQLAFWLNLHNVTIIEQLAINYPVKAPSRIKIGENKTALHDAKIIHVNNVAMSLRDIRENIVYQHWQNPLVMYGFFLGDIGSPTIQNSAFTGENLKIILSRSAEEFTNSLRGFNRGKVSEIYYDTQNYFFKNFEEDLRNHLKIHMFDHVKAELDKTEVLKKDPYEITIADLSGGDSSQNTNFYDARGRSSKTIILTELIEKRRLLRLKGLGTTGTVIIEDIPTNDNKDTNIDEVN